MMFLNKTMNFIAFTVYPFGFSVIITKYNKTELMFICFTEELKQVVFFNTPS